MLNNREAFTLIEIVVILAVLTILAAVAVPMVLRLFQVTAEQATRDEMDNLKNAMIGNPQILQSTVRDDFGFLGDIGCLPTTALGGLDRILTQGTYSAWSFDASKQIGAGWKGPYITGAATGEEAATFKNDQWGNPYTYTPAAGACPLTANLTSNGQDGTFSTSDDITLPAIATETTATTVSGFIKDPNGNPVPSSVVNINYPANGTLTTASATTDLSGFYSVPSIPFGKRSLTFPATSPKLIVTSARATISPFLSSAAICGGGVSLVITCQYLEFTLVNFSTSAVTVTSVRPTYTGGAFYYRIIWGATTNRVLDCSAAGCVGSSGVTKSFAAQTIAAASSALGPTTFTVESSQTQLADIKIGAAGQVGSAVTVRLVNFRDCNTASNCTVPSGPVSVNGVSFTITFSDGSVVQFTPALSPAA